MFSGRRKNNGREDEELYDDMSNNISHDDNDNDDIDDKEYGNDGDGDNEDDDQHSADNERLAVVFEGMLHIFLNGIDDSDRDIKKHACSGI